MSYLNTHTRTASPTKNDLFQTTGRMPALFGVFLGFVKDSNDVQKNGRLRVWIPEMGSAPDNQDGWIIVNYCSPFAGATNVESANKTNFESFEGTQTSYGMWMVPPDVNNQVLIMFINGDPSRGIWIGCLYNQYMNNMIPGMAGSTDNYQYQGKYVPVAEYNKWDGKITQPDNSTKPYESTKFKGLGNQGLITDFHRGVSDSSARRESPSSVFGIVTPGPIIDTSAAVSNIRRKGGSAFIMDDAIGSESVVLTTKSGAQIKLDETNGYIYLINRDGTAWVHMDQKGNIDIFGASNISMRSQSDFNIRADRNVNIEAGQNVYIKAAKDTKQSTTSFTYDVNNIPKTTSIPYYQYVGEGLGTGGNIVIQSMGNIHTTAQKNMYLTVKENNLSIQVHDNFQVTTLSGKQDFNSQGDISIQTSQNYNLKSSLSINNSSGTNISNNAGTNILNQGIFFDINGMARVSGNVDINSVLSVSVGARLGGFVSLGIVVPPTPTISPNSAGSADKATEAEVKSLIEKINILATWEDPDSKFKRKSEAINTTISILPTYEPCPEHEAFNLKSITGYVPNKNEGSKTYDGSGGAGNDASHSPPVNTDPGANNKDVPPQDAANSAVTKNLNMAAYECQLKIHEGVKYVSYLDSLGLPTSGIGHLLRDNEKSMYPVPTRVSEEQVTAWFQIDAPISLGGAQRLLGSDVWGELSDIRKRAVGDLCYNMGENRLSKFKRFIAAMKISDFNAAGDSLRESKWFTQVGRRGPEIITMIVQNVDPTGCDRKFPPTT